MHPAKSVIFFTTASGSGYGLMIWLAVLALGGEVPFDPVFGFVAFALSFFLIVGGLMSSTFHLGHPERAWRALSQWRSSWLSREGIAAISGFVPMGLFALAWVFLGMPAWGLMMAPLSIIMALIIVFTTSMIYASLKSIPAWHSSWTSPGYLVFAVTMGALLAAFLSALWGYSTDRWLAGAAAIGWLVAIAIKIVYWRELDEGPAVSTAETATGLGMFGKVRLVEGPHSEPNYLLNEMGFQVGRKHAAKLRSFALIGFSLGLVLAVCAYFGPAGAARIGSLAGSVLVSSAALVVERWLYFAEAKHVVTLYYGQAAA